MPARVQQGILGTDHEQVGIMDVVHRLRIVKIQVSRVTVTSSAHILLGLGQN